MHYINFFISSKKKRLLLLLITENTSDRVFSARKTKTPAEYREKGLRCFKK